MMLVLFIYMFAWSYGSINADFGVKEYIQVNAMAHAFIQNTTCLDSR